MSAGRTSAITSSIPTSAATARAVAALSPVSEDRAQPERAQPRDGLGRRRLDGVGDDEQRTRRAVPADRDRSATRRLGVARARSRPASSCSAQSASSAGRPTTAPRPSTTPSTPSPDRFAKLSTGGSAPSSARAAAAIARAIGCSEASSSAPATRSTALRSAPRASTTSTRLIRPLVTVPVLSSRIVSTRRVDSRISGPLMSRPSCAPRPVPTSRAVGVARPSAHGQAMISTATAAVNANEAGSPAPSQKPSVATERPITIGTNTPETRSASRCTSALPDWASVTSRAICASAVSEPTFVARTTSRPPALTVAPATASPGCFSTGTDSPVSSDWSTADDALLDDAVGGDLLARADDEAIADRELLDRHPALGAVGAEQRHVLRAELEQRRQRGAGAALGARLEVAPGEQEDRHRGGDLQVELVALRARIGPEARTASSSRSSRRRRGTARTATSPTRRACRG